MRGIAALASECPELAAALQQPAVFIDVGTGIGWLAIEAARTWPALRIVGLDPWEPALTLERRNRAPGGWLIFGLAAAAEEPLEESLVKLPIARSGGHAWTPEEVKGHLRRRDFTQIEVFSPRIPCALW